MADARMQRTCASIVMALALALGAALAACDDEVAVPPMSEPPSSSSSPSRAGNLVAARAAPRDAGPRFASACVPEAAVPAAVAAMPPFESCHRAIRSGMGVHPPGMPPGAPARFDVARTVEARRAGHVVACCYTWPVRPPGAPTAPLPSPTVAPSAGVGTARPVIPLAPPRRTLAPASALPLGMHARPLAPALLSSKLRAADGGARRVTAGSAGSAPSARGTPGSRSPR